MRSMITVLVLIGVLQSPSTDAARVLADMRQALGGDAAIAAINAFSATGSESRNLNGHVTNADVEWRPTVSMIRIGRC
jgi:hypothetical protein